MYTYLTRVTACAAIALTALAVIAAPLVLTVHAGLADAVSLCTPADVPGASADATVHCPPQGVTLRVPRCGVA